MTHTTSESAEILAAIQKLAVKTAEARLARPLLERCLGKQAGVGENISAWMNDPMNRTAKNTILSSALGAGVGGLGGLAMNARSGQTKKKPLANFLTGAALGAGIGGLGGYGISHFTENDTKKNLMDLVRDKWKYMNASDRDAFAKKQGFKPTGDLTEGQVMDIHMHGTQTALGGHGPGKELTQQVTKHTADVVGSLIDPDGPIEGGPSGLMWSGAVGAADVAGRLHAGRRNAPHILRDAMANSPELKDRGLKSLDPLIKGRTSGWGHKGSGLDEVLGKPTIKTTTNAAGVVTKTNVPNVIHKKMTGTELEAILNKNRMEFMEKHRGGAFGTGTRGGLAIPSRVLHPALLIGMHGKDKYRDALQLSQDSAKQVDQAFEQQPKSPGVK